MKKGTLIIFTFLIFININTFAETPKTGGDYEFMSDVMDKGGSVAASGGDYVMYQSLGQAIVHEGLEGNTYELAGGFLNVVDEQPPTIAFASPDADSDNTGLINVVGTAFDESGTEWILYYGTGSEPAVWTQLNSGAENATGATLVSWDASAYAGTYSLKIVAVDDRGNTSGGTVTFSINNLATISGTIPKFKWVLLSAPVSPSPADPISMFGEGLLYKVYRRDPELASDPVSGQYKYPDSLVAGNGFWIKSYYDDLPYSYSGAISDTTQGSVIELKTGWNQIGSPFNRTFPWSAVTVRSGGSEYDLTTAAGMGLISSTLYGYDNSANSWTLYDISHEMQPQTGYDVKAYQNVELLFDPDANIGLMKIVRPRFDYRIKVSATTANVADTDNYIGTSPAASPEYDILDAEEPPKTPDTQFISLYFPNESWTRNAGRFAADFRTPLLKEGDTEQWSFVIETNDIGETVELTWDNAQIPSEGYRLVLKNNLTGEEINMSSTGSYSYTAAGTDLSEASFTITAEKLITDLLTKSITLEAGWNLISIPLEPQITSALEQLGDDIPAMNFYQYFDRKFFAAEKADIQAGLGYWIYVPEQTEIDVIGLPVLSQISIPLKQGWNLIGNPFESAIEWDNSIALNCGDNNYNLAEATAAGITNGKLYKYNGINYEEANSLETWKGYFLKSTQECTLNLSK